MTSEKLKLGTLFKCVICDGVLLVIKASPINKHTPRCCNKYMLILDTQNFYKLPEQK